MLQRRPRRMMNQMNVVPYIDVMLVLLVIFMVTAPMFTPGVIDVPSVTHAAQVDATPLEISIEADGRYFVGEGGKRSQVANLDALIAEVQTRVKDNRPVVVTAHRDLKYSAVVTVADRLHEAGIQRVALTVRQQGS
ncbi:ExbD/TolR family protein [Vogesella sp. LIG4]|uniref:ExbD/TolR family protein n=1 Tax=Vogesella sp. LIG4 TaxID=1192162 RepID=UPI00081FEEAB|nr:ExbD/TolR family protein [Vogesella sp. LIG4]SCK10606.1 biopolymer transport protein TolR [Vogesella sp. LIG4]